MPVKYAQHQSITLNTNTVVEAPTHDTSAVNPPAYAEYEIINRSGGDLFVRDDGAAITAINQSPAIFIPNGGSARVPCPARNAAGVPVFNVWTTATGFISIRGIVLRY